MLIFWWDNTCALCFLSQRSEIFYFFLFSIINLRMLSLSYLPIGVSNALVSLDMWWFSHEQVRRERTENEAKMRFKEMRYRFNGKLVGFKFYLSSFYCFWTDLAKKTTNFAAGLPFIDHVVFWPCGLCLFVVLFKDMSTGWMEFIYVKWLIDVHMKCGATVMPFGGGGVRLDDTALGY